MVNSLLFVEHVLLPVVCQLLRCGLLALMLIALTTPPLDYYCRVIKGAMQGWGIDEGPITRVLGSLDKSEIGDLKARDQKPHTPRAPRPPARAR